MSSTSEPESRFAPRVTVATIVPRDGRFLFVEEWVGEQLMLNQPAGHLDAHETLAHAAVRETREETGWQVEIEHLVAIYQYDAADVSFVRFTFAAKALHHDPMRVLDVGITRALWLSRDELIAHAAPHRSPMVLAGLDVYLAGARHPLAVLRGVP